MPYLPKSLAPASPLPFSLALSLDFSLSLSLLRVFSFSFRRLRLSLSCFFLLLCLLDLLRLLDLRSLSFPLLRLRCARGKAGGGGGRRQGRRVRHARHVPCHAGERRRESERARPATPERACKGMPAGCETCRSQAHLHVGSLYAGARRCTLTCAVRVQHLLHAPLTLRLSLLSSDSALASSDPELLLSPPLSESDELPAPSFFVPPLNKALVRRCNDTVKNSEPVLYAQL